MIKTDSFLSPKKIKSHELNYKSNSQILGFAVVYKNT